MRITTIIDIMKDDLSINNIGKIVAAIKKENYSSLLSIEKDFIKNEIIPRVLEEIKESEYSTKIMNYFFDMPNNEFEELFTGDSKNLISVIGKRVKVTIKKHITKNILPKLNLPYDEKLEKYLNNTYPLAKKHLLQNAKSKKNINILQEEFTEKIIYNVMNKYDYYAEQDKINNIIDNIECEINLIKSFGAIIMRLSNLHNLYGKSFFDDFAINRIEQIYEGSQKKAEAIIERKKIYSNKTKTPNSNGNNLVQTKIQIQKSIPKTLPKELLDFKDYIINFIKSRGGITENLNFNLENYIKKIYKKDEAINRELLIIECGVNIDSEEKQDLESRATGIGLKIQEKSDYINSNKKSNENNEEKTVNNNKEKNINNPKLCKRTEKIKNNDIISIDDIIDAFIDYSYIFDNKNTFKKQAEKILNTGYYGSNIYKKKIMETIIGRKKRNIIRNDYFKINLFGERLIRKGNIILDFLDHDTYIEKYKSNMYKIRRQKSQ